MICVWAAKLHSSTSESHCRDIKPMIDEVVKEGRTVVTIIADGGPDWSTKSLMNALFFCRLWKECHLNILCVTSFAAQFSAYNPIEHLWSPMSKKLASVMFSAIAEGDTKPPCSISGITPEERVKKEAEVFDRAITELCHVHWKDAVFDTFKVLAAPVECNDPNPTCHDVVNKFFKAPLSRMSEYSQQFEEMKFMLKHIQRHRNEVMFLKCLEDTCAYCTTNPPRATKVYKFLQERNMTLFSPMPSSEHLGHYCTFL